MQFCTNLMSLIFIMFASVIVAVYIKKVCAINKSAVNFISSPTGYGRILRLDGLGPVCWKLLCFINKKEITFKNCIVLFKDFLARSRWKVEKCAY
jgi:hypothetical protein